MTSATITLRPYQTEAVAAVNSAWDKGLTRPAVVLPTGTGKSLTMAEIARQAVRGGQRVIVLAHRGELLKQLRKAVHQLDDTISVGIVKAEQREYEADVVVASVQTLASSDDHLLRLDLTEDYIVVVDECHHYAAETYRDVLDVLGAFELGSGVRIVGFTATLWRSDGGLDTVWQEVVFERDIEWAIEQGFLVRPRGLVVVSAQIDLSQVRVVAGDYVQSELEEAMMASVDSTVIAMNTHAKNRACIVFAAGVDHAYALSDALTAAGTPAAAVVGSMTSEERDEVYERFNSGDIDAMVTVTVLTEGADFPRCDTVVMARPTSSKSLYTQMVGRALRLYTDPLTGAEKTDALVMDLAGSSRKMSLASLTDVVSDSEVVAYSPEGDECDMPAEEKKPAPKAARQGVLGLENFDLFAQKHSGQRPARWLITPRGKMFLPGMNYLTYIQLREEDGYWYVLQVTANGTLTGGPFINEPRATVAEAKELAEVKARMIGDLPLRAKTHFQNIAPTEKQVGYARWLGIPDPEQMTKARLNDEISITRAMPRIGDGARRF